MVVASVAVVAVVVSGGGGNSAAAGFTVGTQAVYGKVGPEGVPAEAAAVLAPPAPSLSGDTIDGIACGATEQLTVHVHTHLQIFVDGQPRAVPAAIGLVPPAIVQQSTNGPFAAGTNTCLYWLHTHAQDGILHVEAPAQRQFVLGQFFDIGGQPLDPGQVGPARGAVTVTVDGKPYSGDPRNVGLAAHAQIVINVGGPVVAPPAISFAGTGL